MMNTFRQDLPGWQKWRWMPGLGLLTLVLAVTGSRPACGAEVVAPADRAYLGVSVELTAPEARGEVSLAKSAGLAVKQVQTEGPAAAAGIRVGDALVRMDDQWLFSAYQLRALVRASAPGQPIRFEVSREGELLAANVVLARIPPYLAAEPGILVGNMSWESWNSPQRFTDSLQALVDQGGLVASAVGPLQASPSLGVDLDEADTNWLASLAMDVPTVQMMVFGALFI